MSKHLRALLFWGLSLSFVIFGTSMVLYSQGWRLDTASMKLTQVGAIYVRSYPKNADIFIDGKSYTNESWLLQDGTLISNLFPKDYTVRLRLAGYKEWTEKFSVEPLKVAEVKYAILVPAVANASSTLAALSSDFVPATRGYISITPQGAKYFEKSWPGSSLAGATRNFKYLLLQDGATGTYHLADIDNSTSTNTTSLFKKAGHTLGTGAHLAFVADDPAMIAAWDDQRISYLDVAKKRLLPVEPATSSAKSAPQHPIASFAADKYVAAWTRFNSTTGTSSLSLYNAFPVRQTQIQPASFPGRTIKMSWTANKIALLQDNGDLYLYSPDTPNAPPIARKVKDFEFSDDGTLAAAWGPDALEILAFKEPKDYRRFRLPAQDSLRQFIWYADNQHAFVATQSGYSFLDLNDKFLKNLTPITDSRNARYNRQKNVFSYQKDDTVYEIAFPD